MKNLILLATISLFSAPIFSQTDWCNSHGGESVVIPIGVTNNTGNTEYEIRVYLHIVKNANGTQGVTVTEALDAYYEMVTDFAPYDICFSLAEQDFIFSDDFVNSWGDRCEGAAAIGINDDNDYEELYATNAHEDGIDIYLLPDDWYRFEGSSFGIPGTAFMVGGIFPAPENIPLRSIRSFTHEMGHCLGLSHTFQGSGVPASIGCGRVICDNFCNEQVQGSTLNRQNCGDWVADTPADPGFPISDDPNDFPFGVSYDVNTCTWTNTTITDSNGDLYVPDATNYMAYTRGVCRSSFTQGQVERMKEFLEFSPALAQVVISKNTCTTQAQKIVRSPTYHPIYDNSECLMFTPTIEGYIPYYFYQQGDTMINDTKYYRVVTEIVATDIPGINTNQDFYPGISSVEFYREDIEKKQVWWFFKNTQQEYLIYDFNLEVGDSLPRNPLFVLNKIDTVELKVGPRRRFTFDHLEDDKSLIWIEGVGDVMRGGLAYFNSTYNPPHLNVGLLCFSQNGQLVYNERAIARGLPEDICGTYITVPTKNIPELDPGIQVFPNPGTSSIRVQSTVLEQTPVRWDIRDMLGRVILSQSQKEIINGQPISIEKLDTGLYAITICTEGKRQTLRFVKQ